MSAHSEFHQMITEPSRRPIRQVLSFVILIVFGGLIFLQLTSSLNASDFVELPKQITISTSEQQTLLLQKTGESARKLFIFPVYRIAHYTDSNSGNGDILDYKGPKAVRMIFQRKIGGHRIQEEVKKAIRDRVPPEEWETVKNSATIFCKPYGEGGVKKGDVYSVVWDSKGWLISQFNGQEISRLQDGRFARDLWAIWVGEDSLVDKTDLLGKWDTGS